MHPRQNPGYAYGDDIFARIWKLRVSRTVATFSTAQIGSEEFSD